MATDVGTWLNQAATRSATTTTASGERTAGMATDVGTWLNQAAIRSADGQDDDGLGREDRWHGH